MKSSKNNELSLCCKKSFATKRVSNTVRALLRDRKFWKLAVLLIFRIILKVLELLSK